MLYPIQNEIRNRLDLSGIWDFQIDPDGIGAGKGWANGLNGARPIAVPGSWNEQYEDLYGYLDLAWYVKQIYIPSGWKGERVFLRVGSANYASTVYVNGRRAGGHEGGHLPFAFEVTELIHWDAENVIAISVENILKPERVPPGNLPGSTITGFSTSLPRTSFDFYPYAGIHRPVLLYSVPQAYIQDVTVVTEIHDRAGVVRVTVRLNEAGRGTGSVELRGGDAVLSAPLPFSGDISTVEIAVPDAHFWSDNDPFLYDLHVRIPTDHYSLKTGIRTIAVQGSQILLNGNPVQLNGFGRHEDFPASGRGLNLPLMVKDYQLMRWMGANSYRTSHYPYSEEEMQLADREGFLIIDEIPAVGLHMADEANNPARLRMCLQQIEELIARDKNHPSVVMWSVANEPVPTGLGASAAIGKSIEEMNQPGKEFLDREMVHAHALDPTRPVTFATIGGTPISWMEHCDVICMNRYWGWYVLGGQLEAARGKLEEELDQVWEHWKRPIIMTEFGADTIPGYHGHPDLMWTEEFQANFIRMYLETAAARDFVAGMHVWNFADFAAVQSTGRVGGFNHKGVFTRTRAPKLAAHTLREFWGASENAPEQPHSGLE